MKFVRTNDGRVFAVEELFNTPQAWSAIPATKIAGEWRALKGFKPRLLRKAECTEV